MPNPLADLASEKAEALVGATDGFNSLVDLIGDARFSLIGEATHCAHEFYRIPAQISKVLIAQRGFNAARSSHWSAKWNGRWVTWERHSPCDCNEQSCL